MAEAGKSLIPTTLKERAEGQSAELRDGFIPGTVVRSAHHQNKRYVHGEENFEAARARARVDTLQSTSPNLADKDSDS